MLNDLLDLVCYEDCFFQLNLLFISRINIIDDYVKLANNIFTGIKQKSIKIFTKTEHKKNL